MAEITQVVNIIPAEPDFFQQYFVRPILEQGVAGYNIINTPIYAIIFALAVFSVYKLLKKLNVKIDRSFFIGIFPYIILGSFLRVIRDSGVIRHWSLVSPIIYFLIFILALVPLLLSVYVSKIITKAKIGKGKSHTEKGNLINFFSSYHRLWFLIGTIFALAALFVLLPVGFRDFYGTGLIAGFSLIWVGIIYWFYKWKRFREILTKENSTLLATHMFDASTTFVALSFYPNYYEQHVLSNFVIGFIGPVGQFLLKLAVVIPVLWLLDKELKGDTQLKGFLKVAIFILGFAPGFRNFLRLGFGV